MNKFNKEFKTLNYVINNSEKILIVAHRNPDGDTLGSSGALANYCRDNGKEVDLACYDPIPPYLSCFIKEKLIHPDNLDLKKYDAVIGSDSVQRGFDKIKEKLTDKHVTVIIDHHHDITLESDVKILAPNASSTCELIYKFFEFTKYDFDNSSATYLLLGMIGDTGNFQHANTSSESLDIASILVQKGASVPKIVESAFANKKVSTLKLWGTALEKAKLMDNGMIVTAVTKREIEALNASTEDISQIASILNTVPGTKYSLILSEKEGGIVKGSLRSEEYKGIDVSAIAHKFGGGGHKLASGFEIKGKIVETENGWTIR